MTRAQAIERCLDHFAHNHLVRISRAASSDAEAARLLEGAICAGGYRGPDGWWSSIRAGGGGIAYGDRDATFDDPDGIVTWLDLARGARGAGEQLALDIAGTA